MDGNFITKYMDEVENFTSDFMRKQDEIQSISVTNSVSALRNDENLQDTIGMTFEDYLQRNNVRVGGMTFDDFRRMQNMSYADYLAQGNPDISEEDFENLISTYQEEFRKHEDDFKKAQSEASEEFMNNGVSYSDGNANVELSDDVNEQIDEINNDLSNEITRQRRVAANLMNALTAQMAVVRDDLDTAVRKLRLASDVGEKRRYSEEVEKYNKYLKSADRAISNMNEFLTFVDNADSYINGSEEYDYEYFSRKTDEFAANNRYLRNELNNITFDQFTVSVTFNPATGKYRVDCKCGDINIKDAPEFDANQLTADAVQGILYKFSEKVVENSPLSMDDIRSKKIDCIVDGATIDRVNFPDVGTSLINGFSRNNGLGTGVVSGVGTTTTDAPIPGEGEPLPGEGQSAPSENNPIPGEGEPLPGQNNPVSGEDNPVLGEDNPVLGEDNPVLGEDNPVLGEDNPVPSEDNPVLGEDNPVPSEDKTVLGGDNPIPGGEPTFIEEGPDSGITSDVEEAMKEATRTRSVRMSRTVKGLGVSALVALAATGLGFVPALVGVSDILLVGAGALGIGVATPTAYGLVRDTAKFAATKFKLNRVARKVTKEYNKRNKGTGVKFKFKLREFPENGALRYTIVRNGKDIGYIDSNTTALTLGNGFSLNENETQDLVNMFNDELDNAFPKFNDPDKRGNYQEKYNIPPINLDNLAVAFAPLGGYRFGMEADQYAVLDEKSYGGKKSIKSYFERLVKGANPDVEYSEATRANFEEIDEEIDSANLNDDVRFINSLLEGVSADLRAPIADTLSKLTPEEMNDFLNTMRNSNNHSAENIIDTIRWATRGRVESPDLNPTEPSDDNVPIEEEGEDLSKNAPLSEDAEVRTGANSETASESNTNTAEQDPYKVWLNTVFPTEEEQEYFNEDVNKLADDEREYFLSLRREMVDNNNTNVQDVHNAMKMAKRKFAIGTIDWLKRYAKDNDNFNDLYARLNSLSVSELADFKDIMGNLLAEDIDAGSISRAMDVVTGYVKKEDLNTPQTTPENSAPTPTIQENVEPQNVQQIPIVDASQDNQTIENGSRTREYEPLTQEEIKMLMNGTTQIPDTPQGNTDSQELLNELENQEKIGPEQDVNPGVLSQEEIARLLGEEPTNTQTQETTSSLNSNEVAAYWTNVLSQFVADETQRQEFVNNIVDMNQEERDRLLDRLSDGRVNNTEDLRDAIEAISAVRSFRL